MSLTGLFSGRHTSGEGPTHSTFARGHGSHASYGGQSNVGQHGGSGSGSGSGGGSGGLSGIGWWPSKWSETTVNRIPIEGEFVAGKFALPKGPRPRLKQRDDGSTAASDEDEEEKGADGVEQDTEELDDISNWSGTQRPRGSSGLLPQNFLLTGYPRANGSGSGMEDGDAVLLDVGIVGGTIIVRGVSGEEERLALVRVLQSLVSHQIATRGTQVYQLCVDSADLSSCTLSNRNFSNLHF